MKLDFYVEIRGKTGFQIVFLHMISVYTTIITTFYRISWVQPEEWALEGLSSPRDDGHLLLPEGYHEDLYLCTRKNSPGNNKSRKAHF